MINAFCSGGGWLFGDLLRMFEEAGCVVSAEPLPEADAWICIRTSEWERCRDPRRMVLQLHDLLREYRWPAELGALVLCHPLQRAVVTSRCHHVMSRALGARRFFMLRQRPPSGSLTLGWVGRPAGYQGWRFRTTDALVAAAPPGCRVLLVGQHLRTTAEELHAAGIRAELRERPPTQIEEYPRLYAQMDALVLTSESETGPMPLFEALACGVPVLSRAVGWAPMLIREGINGRLYDTVSDLQRAIRWVEESREDLFARRAKIRHSLGELWLEDWVEENVELARRIQREAA